MASVESVRRCWSEDWGWEVHIGCGRRSDFGEEPEGGGGGGWSCVDGLAGLRTSRDRSRSRSRELRGTSRKVRAGNCEQGTLCCENIEEEQVPSVASSFSNLAMHLQQNEVEVENGKQKAFQAFQIRPACSLRARRPREPARSARGRRGGDWRGGGRTSGGEGRK